MIAQAERLHDRVPFALLQTVPQAPQFRTLVCVSTSQPSELVPLQLPKPAVQDVTVQVPVAHDSDALARLQPTPQTAQSVRVVSDVSHPSFTLPLQLPKPAAHVGTHTPPEQMVLPLAFVHVSPHVPQLAVVLSTTSQPFAGRPSQLP